MARRHPTAVFAAVIVAIAALVGCGSDDDGGNGVAELAADEILERARTAASGATSAHVKGAIEEEGSQVALDMTYKGAEGARGTLTAEGYTFELLRVADDHYLKADAETWSGISGEAAAGELLANRYVLIPPNDDNFADIASFLNWDEFVTEALTPDAAISKGETSEDINGSPAVGLISEGEDGGILWVATEGEPYPLRVEPSEGSASQGVIDFLDWGADVEITAPAADDVIDLSEVIG